MDFVKVKKQIFLKTFFGIRCTTLTFLVIPMTHDCILSTSVCSKIIYFHLACVPNGKNLIIVTVSLIYRWAIISVYVRVRDLIACGATICLKQLCYPPTFTMLLAMWSRCWESLWHAICSLVILVSYSCFALYCS